ncbi:MAG: hypothetical protein EXR76_16365 [Myxococcales bacterium]|nr:hypothetical protein [Myxococcales bacterium]
MRMQPRGRQLRLWMSGLGFAACEAPPVEPTPVCLVGGLCTPGFSQVYEGRIGALVSVVVDEVADTALVVGGPMGNTPGALVLTLSGGVFSEVPTSLPVTPWWITSGDAGLALVGERGLIATADGPTFTQRALDAPRTTLFGVAALDGDRLIAVGGDVGPGGERDVILRGSAEGGFERVLVPDPKGIVFFKVFARSSDDVWICGQSGWVLNMRGDRSDWYRVDPPIPLFTITGDADELYVVGGPTAGLFRFDAGEQGFVAEALPTQDASQLTGVDLAENGDLWVVGMAGIKWRRRADQWTDFSNEVPHSDLHAVAATSKGAIVVGGAFVNPPQPGAPRKGVVGVYVEPL